VKIDGVNQNSEEFMSRRSQNEEISSLIFTLIVLLALDGVMLWRFWVDVL
jgi:hypothetical protein